MSSRLIVNSIRHTGASGDAVSLANDGTCTANITNNLSNRNLVINGAMTIAQRGSSSTDNGYGSVDRFRSVFSVSGTDEAPTQSQGDVASGTTPYSLGFRKTFKITNGNQTSGAGSNDNLSFDHRIEAQDIANSGWNYTSTSSYITLSYWVKSSVSQNFFVRVLTKDGTSQRYAFETGTLTANTWTKVTKTIPGASSLQFDNDHGDGLQFRFYLFRGTDATDNSVNLNQWETHSGSANTPDQTSTWYTTNDATFEITGVQLEVGSTATDFEHRSVGDELARCQRYFCKMKAYVGVANGWIIQYPVTMRAAPSATVNSGSIPSVNQLTTSTSNWNNVTGSANMAECFYSAEL